MEEKRVLVYPGCESCDNAKKNGLCKEKKCVSATSNLGKKIIKDTNTENFPQCVVKKKKGKWEKCSTGPIMQKFGK